MAGSLVLSLLKSLFDWHVVQGGLGVGVLLV